MTDKVRDGTMEKCFFCGANYVETWPVELLAVTICPVCATMSSTELMHRDPEKYGRMLAASGCMCMVDCGCSCEGECDCGEDSV